jgi:hypothetical protein
MNMDAEAPDLLDLIAELHDCMVPSLKVWPNDAMSGKCWSTKTI